MNNQDHKNCRQLLAGTIMTDCGIHRNMVVSRSADSSIEMHPFCHETHSTPFVELIALIDPEKLTDETIKEIERVALYGDSPEIYSFLRQNELLSSLSDGRLLSVGAQSIIIEM